MINNKSFVDFASELKTLRNIDESFLDKLKEISLEDLIYLKLYLSYNNLNQKFVIGLPIFEIIDKIVTSTIERFDRQFNKE